MRINIAVRKGCDRGQTREGTPITLDDGGLYFLTIYPFGCVVQLTHYASGALVDSMDLAKGLETPQQVLDRVGPGKVASAAAKLPTINIC